jgi:UDP-glucuronate decarboxylase
LLEEESNTVLCLDNYYSGGSDNIIGLEKHPRFDFIHHDIVDYFPLHEVDQIYHLACPASPIHYQKSSIYTSKVNTLGTFNILDLAKENNARILYTSTSEVYGNPLVSPQPETYYGNTNPIGPRACYHEGKRFSESLFYDYWRNYNLDIKIVRIFNSYGPYMQFDDGRIMSNFILQALRGNPLTVYGDGKQTRSFCYVDDIVEAMILFMNYEDYRGPINIGRTTEVDVMFIAEKIIKMCNSSSQIMNVGLPKDDPKIRRPDVQLIKQLIGWESKTTLEEGLSKTIAWFKEKFHV